MTIKMIEYALYYAKLGFAVFPLAYKGKTPVISGGFKNATTDEMQIQKWWEKHPHANIGIATGQKSGNIFVIDLDVDDDKGINGYDTLRDWQRDHGALPETAMSITGRGGNHLFFKADRPIRSRTGILEGIDIRGNGGYIVAPPSLHKNGKRYQWEQEIVEFGITNADESVYKLLNSGSGSDVEGTDFHVGVIIESGNRNATLYKMACSLQAKGFSDETIKIAVQKENQLKCSPPLEDDELERTIQSALTKDKGNMSIVSPPRSREFLSLERTKPKVNQDGEVVSDGRVRQTIENACIVLRSDENFFHGYSPIIRLNSLTHSIFVCGKLPWRKEMEYREWNDTDDSNLLCYMEQYGLSNKENTLKALDIVSDENRFNPVVEHLEGLPKWDGKDHIGELLPNYLGVEKNAYTSASMKLFMLGAIARAYKPGCKFDYMLVLVGDQGVGKSTFLRRLAMSDAWYDDNFNTVEGDKAVERLRGMWFVELAELLAAKRQKEVESIKAFLTSTVDTYRPPYGRRTVQRPRRCVFAGTTNNSHFLTDTTGNRRYLPIRVNRNKIKQSLFNNLEEVRADIEQAWAQALHIYKIEKPELVMPKKLEKETLDVQNTFLEEDARVGIIQEWLDNTSKNRVCVMQIWEDALRFEGKPKRKESNEIHDIMRNAIVGWRDIGRKKTSEYGSQICYEREEQDGLYEVQGGEY